MQNQSSPAPDKPRGPQQDPELWFADGNVVIVAGDAAFCVHSGILSRHSEIFQNLFTVPQPPHPTPSDMMDGCPVVRITDSAYDFKQMLHMLYDGVKFMPPDTSIDFIILAALARLRHKYQIEWVLAEATRRLKTVFAESLERWCGRFHNEFVSNLSPPRYIEAIKLFQSIGETSMLPAAIYESCQYSSLLFESESAKRVDGTMDTLDLSTLQLCFQAQRALLEREVSLDAEILEGPSSRCLQTETCGSAMEAVYREIGRNPASYLFGDPMTESCWGMGIADKVCEDCWDAVQERDLEGRRAIWADLPKLTGVAGND